ncbi:MAG: sortase [Candidatus Levybacteria bacterium]|nr:sortase [Candidatus Levybacteria bacterium]MBP9814832.1 sortase [Candidatus Levybacteria bacterium]
MKPYKFVKQESRLGIKKRKVLGLGIILFGIVVLLYYFFPIFSDKSFYSSSDAIIIPVPKYAMVKGGIGDVIRQGINSLTHDYNDARNWYPQITAGEKNSVPLYSLSIPKLKIIDAKVSTVDYDLTSHLVQYIGTAIPGENGTAVIFGHSTLPHLFNPKNYKSIFATLHTIKVGDEIITSVNNITYKYKIFSVTVTTPEDTDIFSQSFDHSYLTIVTCTPPGTVWKRLIVRALLEEVDKKAKGREKEKTNIAGRFIEE